MLYPAELWALNATHGEYYRRRLLQISLCGRANLVALGKPGRERRARAVIETWRRLRGAKFEIEVPERALVKFLTY